jgi:hypothetical protein
MVDFFFSRVKAIRDVPFTFGAALAYRDAPRFSSGTQTISAELNDGVLTLTLKKAKEALPTRIAIS